MKEVIRDAAAIVVMVFASVGFLAAILAAVLPKNRRRG